MEWMLIPAVAVGVIVWLVVVGRGRNRVDRIEDGASAHVEAEARKYDWFGNGKR